MKVITPQEMVRLESKAYRMGYLDCDFMNQAGFLVAKEVSSFITKHHLHKKIWLLCGKGNNGGDTFVAGLALLDFGFEVIAVQLDQEEACSPLCQKNQLAFVAKQGTLLRHIPSFGSEGVIVDGLFGTGFKGVVQHPFDQLIQAANESGLPILSVDIPSGLDGQTGQVSGEVIEATSTFFLGLPKTGFFLNEGWNKCGSLKGLDFGMPTSLYEEAISDFNVLDMAFVKTLLPKIKRNRHKYEAGTVVGLAGSSTMPGAAILGAKAAFRGGAGMVRLLYPMASEVSFSTAPYEVIRLPYNYNQSQEVIGALQKGDAAFIGPGMGRSKDVQFFLQEVVSALDIPVVIDADALFWYAKNKFKLPPQTIFTPHSGEMQRLLHDENKANLCMDHLKRCQDYAEENQITLVYKGAPSFIFSSGKPPFVNPTGDPGMATAGSGDVLTGLLAALLAQGLTPHTAALLGVYVHGLSGELAAKKRGTSLGVMASDLISEFGSAYSFLEQNQY